VCKKKSKNRKKFCGLVVCVFGFAFWSDAIGHLLSYFVALPAITFGLLLPFALMAFTVEGTEDLSKREPWLNGSVVTIFQAARCTAVLCTLFTILSRLLVVRYVFHFLYRYFGATVPPMHFVMKAHRVVSWCLFMSALIHWITHGYAQETTAAQNRNPDVIRPIYRSSSSLHFSVAGITGMGMMFALVAMIISGYWVHGVQRHNAENGKDDNNAEEKQALLKRRRKQCLPIHDKLASTFVLLYIIHGSEQAFGVFPANAAVMGGFMLSLLFVDTICSFIFPRHSVRLPRVHISAKDVDFIRDENGYMTKWGTRGPFVDTREFFCKMKKGKHTLLGLRVKLPVEFAQDAYPGWFAVLSIDGPTKDIAYNVPISPSLTCGDCLDLIIQVENNRDSHQSWTSDLLQLLEHGERSSDSPPATIGIRGPIAGPISAAIRMCCEHSKDKFIIIVICSGTGIAVGVSRKFSKFMKRGSRHT